MRENEWSSGSKLCRKRYLQARPSRPEMRSNLRPGSRCITGVFPSLIGLLCQRCHCGHSSSAEEVPLLQPHDKTTVGFAVLSRLGDLLVATGTAEDVKHHFPFADLGVVALEQGATRTRRGSMTLTRRTLSPYPSRKTWVALLPNRKRVRKNIEYVAQSEDSYASDGP